MIRLLFVLVLAALEATLVSLPLTALTGANVAWALLFGAVAWGWLADQLVLRLPARYERPALLGAALLAADLLLAGTLGLAPLAALGALLLGGTDVLQAYMLLLLALFLFWRGSRIDTRDSSAISTLFGRGAAVAVVSLLLGAISGTGAPMGSPAVLGHVVGFMGLGLLALALAHAQEVAGGRLRGLEWRWLLTLVAAIALVLALALGATSLLGGGEGMAAAQNLLRLLLLPLALVGGAIAWLVITFLAEPLMRVLQLILARFQGLELAPPPEQSTEQAQGAATAVDTIERLANGATFLLALIPIVILVVAILLLRRRRKTAARPDEERESLGVLASIGGDLRDLLRGLRNPFARPLTGLRAALAALPGADPSSRARRAYVRLLLLLEARERPREPAQTPAELAPAAALATEAAEPVGRLTAAYEQARYNPSGATAADAEAAEAALRSIGER